jgi:D-glycero-alpha-D-manno-heptose-7-phosphate kinase
MKKVVVTSPTRVDLAGGTLDLWPLSNFVGGAETVNVAIDIMTTVEISERADDQIELISADLKTQQVFGGLDELLHSADQQWSLLKAQFEYWRPEGGLTLRTQSQSPVGGGLGGSSSLTISLLKAFNQWIHGRHSHFGSVQDMVQTAHNIEAQVLGTPTGTQDYFPAVSGGLNILKYTMDGCHQDVLPIEGSALEQHFMLVYTGKSHHSGINNFEVLTKAVQKDRVVLGALAALKEVAASTAQVCRQGQYHELPSLFRREFQERVRLAKAFSSPEIEKLHEVALQAGAEAVKICGAGGGGCVLVWVAPERRSQVRDACEKRGFQVLPAKPVAPLNGIESDTSAARRS